MNLYRFFCSLVFVVALVSVEARAQNLEVLWSDGLGTGTNALTWLSGDMDGDGRTDIFHPWNNNGTLGLHVYQSTGTSYVATFNSSNMGHGAYALTWLTGDMDGDGRTDILQPWNNNGQLGLIVYRSTGTGYTAAFASSNMGAGSGAVAWRTGDADGDGRTDLIQLWNNRGWLGLTVFRSTGTGYALWFNNPNMGQGSTGRAWLTGDMDGDGRTDIFQPWNNNGTLGLIAYRATGTGYATAFSSSNMGQGSGALAWLAGDMDGDGRTDIFQPFDNQGTIGLIAYRSTGTGFATAFTTGFIGSASEWSALGTADFNGDGLTDIFQSNVTNAFVVTFIFSTGTGFTLGPTYGEFFVPPLYPQTGYLGWLVGNFEGGPRDAVVQLLPHAGSLASIVYGLK